MHEAYGKLVRTDRLYVLMSVHNWLELRYTIQHWTVLK